jgi:hypothetical protein
MIGYDVSWASFSIVEVMSQSRFAHKRVGYLAACQVCVDSTYVCAVLTHATVLYGEHRCCLTDYESFQEGIPLSKPGA